MEVDLLTYIDRGGIIVYILIFLNIIGFSIMFWKLVVIALFKNKRENLVSEIIIFAKENSQEFKKDSIENFINRKIRKLEFGLNTVKIIASISPLLGLLGTVIGVLDSFDSNTKSGLGDPSIFSAGISLALITTIAGIIVAIPHYIGYNYIAGILDDIELKIQKEVLKKIWKKEKY